MQLCLVVELYFDHGQGFLTLSRRRPSNLPLQSASTNKRSERAAIVNHNTMARDKRRKRALDLHIDDVVVESIPVPPLSQVASVDVEEDESLSKEIASRIDQEIVSSESIDLYQSVEGVRESLDSTGIITPCEGEKERVQSLVMRLEVRNIFS